MTSRITADSPGSSYHAQIDEALAQAGASLSPAIVEGLAVQMARVIEYNQHTNVTAIREPNAFVWLHVVDSLLALPEIEAAGPGLLVDIGSGAGYPGVPLLLASGRQGLLVDSVSKKARLLSQIVEDLDINASVSDARVEELGERDAAVVTARAVSSLPALVELAAPLLRLGGRLVALKGDIDAAEVDRAAQVGLVAGMSLREQRRYVLPYERSARSVLVFEKTGDPKVALPRRVGLAQKEPLA
jgi:16S rRNA (guanine527-N7)-methyltransferase